MLPPIDTRRKWRLAAIGYVCFAILYTFTGNVYLRAPVTLAPGPVDRLIPFLPWTVWVYNAQFFFLAFCVWTVRRAANVGRLLYSLGLVSLASFTVFLIYPTRLPRPLPPLEGPTARLFELLYAVDSDANCLPSLHVALGWTAALCVLDERRRMGWVAVAGAAVITTSTLTTKQHYFVDVAAGLGLALLCRLLTRAKTKGAEAGN